MKKLGLILLLFLIATGCSKKASGKDTEVQYDIDLTSYSYDELSNVLINMIVNPDTYVNKTIKFSGEFYSQEYEGKRYFSIIKWNEDRSCPAGLDFIPPENMEYPKHFPGNSTEITIFGKIESVSSGDNQILTFVADKFMVN